MNDAGGLGVVQCGLPIMKLALFTVSMVLFGECFSVLREVKVISLWGIHLASEADLKHTIDYAKMGSAP